MDFMKFFRNLFSKKVIDKCEYDSSLIKTLKKEHAILYSIYTEMLKTLQAGDPFKLTELMEKFKKEATNHILKEDEKLYSYLISQSKTAEEKEELEAMHKEMKDIVNNVVVFFNTFDSAVMGSKKDIFKKGLEDIGVTLTARIEKEETYLYTLYKK